MEAIVPKSEARILLGTSFLSTTSLATAVWLGLYDCAVISAAALFCSVNYWSHPVYGTRRNLDMAVAAAGVTHHVYMSYIYGVYKSYLFFSSLGVAAYLLGRILEGRKATVAHSCMHVLGNIGNIRLYRSLTDPPPALAEFVLGVMILLTVIDWPPKWWPVAEYPEM